MKYSRAEKAKLVEELASEPNKVQRLLELEVISHYSTNSCKLL